MLALEGPDSVLLSQIFEAYRALVFLLRLLVLARGQGIHHLLRHWRVPLGHQLVDGFYLLKEHKQPHHVAFLIDKRAERGLVSVLTACQILISAP